MSYFTAQLGEAVRIAEAHLIAARFTRENERMAQMDRLTEKLNRAAGVVGRVTARLEERADLVIAREDAINQRGARLFGAKHAILDDGQGAGWHRKASGTIEQRPFGSLWKARRRSGKRPRFPTVICSNCGGANMKPFSTTIDYKTVTGVECSDCRALHL